MSLKKRLSVLWGEVHDPNAWAMGGVAGHAGLFSNADDVMRFAQTLLDVWHRRSDAFPHEWLQRFLTRETTPIASSWALGWDTPTPGASTSGTHFSAHSVGHLGFTGTSLWIDLELFLPFLCPDLGLAGIHPVDIVPQLVCDLCVEIGEIGQIVSLRDGNISARR